MIPRCAHYTECGGCQSQHLAQAVQLAAKQRSLLDDLQRIGHVHPEEVLKPVTGPLWGYRRRARLSARCVGPERHVLVGFSRKNRRGVTPTRQCEILDPRVGPKIGALAETLTRLSIADRIPQVELAAGDREVVLLLRILADPEPADCERLLEFERNYGLRVYLQRGRAGDSLPLAGEPARLDYHLPQWNLELEFGPGDFIQVNAAINRRLVSRALELLQVEAWHRVLDLFCGLGNFTLPLAKVAAAAVGVEGDASLVARAQVNAARNGVGNARFHQADLFADQTGAAWLQSPYDRLLLDPPRAGACEILGKLRRHLPARIVYVSCHPMTLARDAGWLVHVCGYQLAAVGMLDMFPHTTHVEVVAAFERRI